MKNRVYASGVRDLSFAPEIRDHMTEAARVVYRLAVRRAPFRRGTYRASLSVRRYRSGPAKADVITRDPKAVYLEYGTGQPGPSPHFDTLTKAVLAAGFKRVDVVPHGRRGRAG